jgi:hypothetical protein
LTATVKLLLWRDNKKAVRTEDDGELSRYDGGDSPQVEGSDVDEKKAVHSKEAPLLGVE